MKNILLVDDSALMRRYFCNVLHEDGRFKVTGQAKDGVEALELLLKNSYDGIVLDINMPRMNGIQFLEELNLRNIKQRIIVASTDTVDGADITLKALELGALDFIHKPNRVIDKNNAKFRNTFLTLLENVCNAKIDCFSGDLPTKNESHIDTVRNITDIRDDNPQQDKVVTKKGNKLVAIACSTGGPKALQEVIPLLPKNLDAPVLIVQHMPSGFTKSLALRLDSMSDLTVTEAEDGDVLEKGHVYISKGGQHLKYSSKNNSLYYTDEPYREGVRPCANYMYESLMDSSFDEITCVVLTGMGADGTVGIKELSKKKKIYVISQSEASCIVYGMPKNIYLTGLVNEVADLDKVATQIIKNVGVR